MKRPIVPSFSATPRHLQPDPPDRGSPGSPGESAVKRSLLSGSRRGKRPQNQVCPSENTPNTETVVREVGGRSRTRRKEVALGRLSTFTVLVTLGTWVAATEGAPPQETSPPASVAKQPLPKPAGEYVKAGQYLYQQGDLAKAQKYLKVAAKYRDDLTADEQATLDNV